MPVLHADIERVALLGWRCVPVTRKRTGFFKGYIDAATCDLDHLAMWAAEFPGCNWSVIPAGSGVWALDIDVPGTEHEADGVAAMKALTDKHGPLPAGPHGRSGGGGHLLVFQDTGAPIKCESGTPSPGIDPRARRVQFTIAPSRHRSGGAYTWRVAPWEVSPPPAPDWLLRAVAPPPPRPLPARPRVPTTDIARRQLSRALDNIASAPAGRRNSTLNQQAFSVSRWIAAGLLDEAEAIRALYAAGMALGLTTIEVRATIKSGCLAGAQHPIERNAGHA